MMNNFDKIALRVTDSVTAMLGYWSKDQICCFANKSYQEWFNKTPEEMIGITLEAFLGPAYQPSLPYIEGALAGDVQVFEREMELPAGGTRWLLATYFPDIVNQTVEGFFVHAADTTALKRLAETEKDLFKSRALFEVFMENSPIPAWITDEAGVMQYMNPAYCHAVGKDQSVIGQSIYHLFKPDLADRYMHNNSQVLQNGQTISGIELGVDSDNHVATNKVVKFPLLYHDQKMVAGWSVNITEQLRLQKELADLVNTKRREMLRSVIDARENEKEHVAQQIRDNINHTLAYCRIMLQQVSEKKFHKDSIDDVGSHINKSIWELNKLSTALSSSMITDIGLKAGLADYFEYLEEQYPISISFSAPNENIEHLIIKDKVSVFRVIQNLLLVLAINTRHALAEIKVDYTSAKVVIRLSYSDAEFDLARDCDYFVDITHRVEYHNGIMKESLAEGSRIFFVELPVSEN